MKLIVFSMFLLASASLHASGEDSLLALSDHIMGPVVRVNTLSVSKSGVVTDVHYDISAESNEHWPSNGTRRLGTLSASQLQTIKAYIGSEFGRLPRVIDSGAPIPLDGPDKSICVEIHSNRVCSVMYENQAPDQGSSAAQSFRSDWQRLTELLQSAGG